MSKHATKRGTKEGAVVAHPSATRRVRLGEVLVQARTALREIVVGAGFKVLTAMLEEDRETLFAWEGLKGLERLDLSNNTLGQEGTRVLASCPSLASLTERNFQLVAETPNGLGPEQRYAVE